MYWFFRNYVSCRIGVWNKAGVILILCFHDLSTFFTASMERTLWRKTNCLMVMSINFTLTASLIFYISHWFFDEWSTRLPICHSIGQITFVCPIQCGLVDLKCNHGLVLAASVAFCNGGPLCAVFRNISVETKYFRSTWRNCPIQFGIGVLMLTIHWKGWSNLAIVGTVNNYSLEGLK